MVRPWKPWSAATMTGAALPCLRRTTLSAASLASVPELQKKTRASACEEAEQLLGEQHAGLVDEEVAGVRDLADLVGDRRDDGGVRVAERGDRDARDQVEVAVAVGVPDLAALAAVEGKRRHAVVGHHRRREPLLQGFRTWGFAVAWGWLTGFLQSPWCRCLSR